VAATITTTMTIEAEVAGGGGNAPSHTLKRSDRPPGLSKGRSRKRTKGNSGGNGENTNSSGSANLHPSPNKSTIYKEEHPGRLLVEGQTKDKAWITAFKTCKTCTIGNAQVKICKFYNDHRVKGGCKRGKDCPDAHVCDVQLQDGGACGNKDHHRCNHSKKGGAFVIPI
jgi:hypothetical protein